MAHDFKTTNHEFSRPYDPWEKFTRRDETKHRAEDTFRLCSQNAPSYEVIDVCFAHGSRPLDDPIPRRNQILRDFLEEVLDGPVRSNRPYPDDIARRNSDNHIVLVDDRQNHSDCEKKIRRACAACRIFSQNVTVRQLREHLAQEVD